MYDLDGDGTIAHKEMLQIVTSVYQMVGHVVKFPMGEETPEKVRLTKSVSKAAVCADKKDLGGNRHAASG